MNIVWAGYFKSRSRPAMQSLTIFFTLLALVLTDIAPAPAAEVDDLAKKILKSELAWQKLNDQLHLAAANPSFNRTRRTWLWDIGNALPTEGGLIAATAVFLGRSKNRGQIAGTVIPQIAGQVIGGTGSYYELYADSRRAYKLHHQGLDRYEVTSKAKVLQTEIDSLLCQYERRAGTSDLYAGEIKILKDIRQNEVYEFARLEKGAALISTGQLIEDLASAGRNTVGAVGNSINVAAIYRNNKRLNGKGDILNLIAATTISIRPFVSNLGCLFATRASKRRTQSALGAAVMEPNDTLAADVAKLRSFPLEGSTASGVISKRMDIYTAQVNRDVDQKALALEESKKAKQLITRRFRESFYGPTKMAQATMGIVIGFRPETNAVARRPTGRCRQYHLYRWSGLQHS